MPQDYSEFKEGNWVIYLPENNYCTIKSLSPKLVLEGVKHNYPCRIENIGKIKITTDKLQVCGFDVNPPTFRKISKGEISVVLILSSPGMYSVYKNDEILFETQFIHEVQNVYYQITGELLRGNLYGVAER